MPRDNTRDRPGDMPSHEGKIHIAEGDLAVDVDEKRAVESYKKIRQGSLKGGQTTRGMIEFAKSQGFMGGSARGGSVPEHQEHQEQRPAGTITKTEE